MKISKLKIKSNLNNTKTNMFFPKYMNNSFISNSNEKYSNFYSDERNDRIIFKNKKKHSLNNSHIFDKNNLSSIHNFKLNFPEIKKNNINFNLTNNKDFYEKNLLLKKYNYNSLIKLKNENEKFLEIDENKNNLSAIEIYNSRINYFFKISQNMNNNINKKIKKTKINTKYKNEIHKNGILIFLNNSKGISLSMNGNSFDKGNKNTGKKTFSYENIKKKFNLFKNQYFNKSKLFFENEKIRKVFKNSFRKIKVMKINTIMSNNFKSIDNI